MYDLEQLEVKVALEQKGPMSRTREIRLILPSYSRTVANVGVHRIPFPTTTTGSQAVHKKGRV